ncbi:uncharacterized protein MAM_02241 [Metarhizium album ARSEF 1941]|uniref:Uncharacterized protein n=1 Tax=Metarhizium album (strain ARSEF 1941) TaxID=1081103 RepID=A0A0B2X3L2_METAS|nr:uncharacterized protein MAM_02241 [Metarhizium album ARSEF 1941]KHO00318.1 hypothetical protein MAM_02241 [Metarhizium album ARSEF 1941]
MPCCVATLHYLGCQHRMLYKLHCTTFQCDEHSMCPRERQSVLLAARYRWSCEDCTRRQHRIEDNERANKWTEKVVMLAGDVNLSKDDWRNSYRLLELRSDFTEAKLRKKRTKQLSEIQRAEKWVHEYAWTILELLHGDDDFEDISSEDGDISMSGVEDKQLQASHAVDVPMLEAGPEQDEEGQEQQDVEMGGQQGISSEPSYNSDAEAQLERLEEMFLAKDNDLILVRDASGTACRQQVTQKGAARPFGSAAASKSAAMPAAETESNIREPKTPPVLSFLGGIPAWGAGLR